MPALHPNDHVCVVLEYDPDENRVFVRGIFDADTAPPKRLRPENTQNHVACFLGVDMGRHVGMTFKKEEAVCEHNWQRRRDGRWCALCDVVEYGQF